MNHHQRKVLQAIFAHPVNANLDLKDVRTCSPGSGPRSTPGRRAGSGSRSTAQTTLLHLAHHSLMKAEVMQIRKFLEACGISAGAYPA